MELLIKKQQKNKIRSCFFGKYLKHSKCKSRLFYSYFFGLILGNSFFFNADKFYFFLIAIESGDFSLGEFYESIDYRKNCMILALHYTCTESKLVPSLSDDYTARFCCLITKNLNSKIFWLTVV